MYRRNRGGCVWATPKTPDAASRRTGTRNVRHLMAAFVARRPAQARVRHEPPRTGTVADGCSSAGVVNRWLREQQRRQPRGSQLLSTVTVADGRAPSVQMQTDAH